jgi:hypothetical protein
MIEIEPDVPRRVRILFMVGGGALLFVLVMTIILMGRSPEPSHVLDDDPLPPIQQRYNVDPLRPTQRQSVDDDSPSVLNAPTLTTRSATSSTTRPSTRPAAASVVQP